MLNDAFTPSDAELAAAREALAAFEAAGGSTTLAGGLLVDLPATLRARRLLELVAAL